MASKLHLNFSNAQDISEQAQLRLQIVIKIKALAMIKRTNSFELEEDGGKNQMPGAIKPSQNDNGVASSKIIRKYDKNHSNDDLLEKDPNVPRGSIKQIDMKDIRVSQPPASGANKTDMAMTSNRAKNLKIPQPILQSIIGLASGRKPAGSMTNSQVSRAIFQKFREIKANTFICEICSMEYSEKDRQKISKCAHFFCDSCLRHYVDYKISRFEEVLCPAENCTEALDIEGPFYASLTDQHKEKYKKVHAFAVVSKNPNSRLCPNQKCKDGILELQEGVNPRCRQCSKVYCHQCLFPEHSGPCQSNQIDFFQNNLHFRQCSNCKSVVEKTVGCNHIKCRCNYEFCYLCGGKWLNYEHRCGPQGQPNVAAPAPETNCCQCLAGDGCCQSVARVLVKAIFLFPLFLLLLVLVTMMNLVLLAGVLFMTLLMGIFPYTFEFICEKDCPWVLLLLILYPISMVIGIGKAFGDFFCEVAPRIMEQYCEQVGGIADCLLLW